MLGIEYVRIRNSRAFGYGPVSELITYGYSRAF